MLAGLQVSVQVKSIASNLAGRLGASFERGRRSMQHEMYKGWGGRRGSNPRHSVPQTDALPAELLPPSIELPQFTLICACRKVRGHVLSRITFQKQIQLSPARETYSQPGLVSHVAAWKPSRHELTASC